MKSLLLCVLAALVSTYLSLQLKDSDRYMLVPKLAWTWTSDYSDEMFGFSGFLGGALEAGNFASWYAISATNFDDDHANLICQRLGFTTVEYFIIKSVSEAIQYFSFDCNEQSECSITKVGFYEHNKTVPWISCVGPFFRIAGSGITDTKPEGVLLASMDNSNNWGPVCQYSGSKITQRTGKSICQQLRFRDLATVSTIGKRHSFVRDYSPVIGELDFLVGGRSTTLTYETDQMDKLCSTYSNYVNNAFLSCSCWEGDTKTSSGCVKNCPDNSFWERSPEKASDICICNLNFFRNTEGPLTCSPCPGKSTAAKHQSFCVCEAGSFWNATLEDCQTCGMGEYNSLTNRTSCLACPELSSSLGNATKCSCEVGYMWSQDRCIICPKNTFSLAGSDSCTDCPKFMVSEEGTGVCSTCAPGEFWDNHGNGSCYRCPDHLYGDGANCVYCSLGWNNVTGNCLKEEVQDSEQSLPVYSWFIAGVLVTAVNLVVIALYRSRSQIVRGMECCHDKTETSTEI